ncbi:putative reverse transcriptase zinc-binding domain-containing protein [Arabidopsis thaliana]
MWKKLLKYRHEAKEFFKMEVFCGRQTSFWYDHWCSLGQLHGLLGDRGFIDLGISSSCSVAEALSSHRRRSHRDDILNDIEEELEKLLCRGICTEQDRSLCRSIGGQFKAKFFSPEIWHQIREQGLVKQWHKAIWFSGATPKFTFISWLAAHDRLTTGDKMASWNRGISSVCVLCNISAESRDHLFFSCNFSSHIWDRLTRRLLLCRYTTNFPALLLLLSGQDFSGTKRFLLRYVFQATIHTLWRERNKRRHGDLPIPSDHIIKFIDRQTRNRLSTITKQGLHKYADGLRIWFAARDNLTPNH